MAEFSLLFNSSTPRWELNATVFRIVEAGRLGTANVTDTLADQHRLDALIGEVQPVVKSTSKHYLITKPFRRPPLKYGSRFGTIQMNSFFYASKSPLTCLVECAFYQFLMLSLFKEPFNEAVETSHTLFSCSVSSRNSLDLTASDFYDVVSDITHPDDYSFTQKIGKWAIDNNGYQIICFPSARHKEGVNYAVSDIDCIKSKSPRTTVGVLSIATNQKVVFEYDSNLYSVPNTVSQYPVSM